MFRVIVLQLPELLLWDTLIHFPSMMTNCSPRSGCSLHHASHVGLRFLFYTLHSVHLQKYIAVHVKFPKFHSDTSWCCLRTDETKVK